MAIKNYAVTQRYYPGLCSNYEALTTHQAIEVHNPPGGGAPFIKTNNHMHS